MSKSRKKIRKKINPERSNKMIYAVGAGLIIVFSIFFFLFTGKTEISDKPALMKDTLKYLNKTEGLTDIKYFPEKNSISIYYKSFKPKEKKKKPDYQRIALYAGLKLSNKIGSENVTVELFSDRSPDPELILLFKNGKVLNRIK